MKKIFFTVVLGVTSLASAHAASLVLTAPEITPSDGHPIEVVITLDAEEDSVGAIAGTFSFPSDLFEIERISTKDSVVSLWLTPPKLSNEHFFDNRTRISFEGIFPGGFTGVRSPFYEGMEPGVVATVYLVPKQAGSAYFLIDDVELRRSDSVGTLLSTQASVHPVTVPYLSKIQSVEAKESVQVPNDGMEVVLARSDLIANSAWHAILRDNSTTRTINHFEVAESRKYSAHDVKPFLWRTSPSPYILINQSRSVYLHVKAVYDDGSYAYTTIAPVENSEASLPISRILTIISFLVILAYLYSKKLRHVFIPQAPRPKR